MSTLPGGGTPALFGGVGAGTSEGMVAGRAGVSFGWCKHAGGNLRG